MRAFAAEDEERVYRAETARGWRRSGLVSEEQLAGIEKEIGALPLQASWPIRVLLFAFALGACAAYFGVVEWLVRDRRMEGLWFCASSPALYFLALGLIVRHRLYRFGIEEGLLLGAAVLLFPGVGALASYPARALLAGSAGSAALVFLALRFGYLWARLGAILAVSFTVADQCRGLSENETRVLFAALYAAALAASFRFRPPDFDRSRHQTVQGVLALGVGLFLNLKLDAILSFGGRASRGAGAFYWATFAAAWLLPALALAFAVRRRHRALLIAGALLAGVACATNKPYLGLERRVWDPAVFGALLMAVGAALTRWLRRGPEGRRDGWTAEPLIAGRGERAGLAAWLAGAAAAPGRAAQPGFSGGGGSSGGAGAGGAF
ncbi:MAG TPA: hypothetical protein VNI01_07390 [Elusimicrobiota bacterium]|nr:hypothetical protein [Elusimicrobiota bacterium]